MSMYGPEDSRGLPGVDGTWFDGIQRRWTAFTEQFVWLRWVERWGLSAGSLVLGALTLFIFRRGIEYFAWFIGYLVLLLLGGVAFAEARRSLRDRGRKVIGIVVDYTVQVLFHGLLLFLLPIYYASTTFASWNGLFFLVLAAAALVTAVDPWYRAILIRFRWIEIVLFGFGLFASLNVAFPLIGVRSSRGLILSGALSILALAPIFRRAGTCSWRDALLKAGTWGVGVVILLWLVRGWLPPVPLHLARASFARTVLRLEPFQPVSTLAVAELKSWGELTVFTAVAAPAGLREPIVHEWRKDGVVVARIALSAVRGGRAGGFRTYSRKSDLGSNPVGSWTVDVLTDQSQLIGRVRLRVTP